VQHRSKEAYMPKKRLFPIRAAAKKFSPSGSVPNKSVFSYLRTLTTWHCPHSHGARCCCSSRSLSPARRAHNSRPAVAGLLLWAHAETDGRTPYRFRDAASRTVRTAPTKRLTARESVARFTNYLTTILRLSYDNAKSYDRITTDV